MPEGIASKIVCAFHDLEVQRKTGAKVAYNGIVGRKCGAAPFVSFPKFACPQNKIEHEFGTSLYELRKR